jgi:hypothetical protein
MRPAVLPHQYQGLPQWKGEDIQEAGSEDRTGRKANALGGQEPGPVDSYR